MKEGTGPTIRTTHTKSPRCMNTEGTTTRESSSVINPQNNPPVQPREHACACRDCGLRVTGRRVEPRTMTWRWSGLCERHEAQRAEVAA